MGKVKAGYRKPFTWRGKQCDRIVLLDVADDAEGYGVVFGGDDTDRTVAFGEGEFALALANLLYTAIQNELDSYADGTDFDEFDFEHEKLESLYDWEKRRVLTDIDHAKELKKIVDYINKWCKDEEE